MADPLRAHSIYRYFDLADAFVRVRVVDAASLAWPQRESLNRASYRRFVLQECMPELGLDSGDSLASLFPEDPLLVEDLLYQMCIEVNPSLDIHEVRLQGEEERSEEPRPRVVGRARGTSDPEDFRRRLAERAQDIERRLGRQLIGQQEAVRTVARSLRRAAAGLAHEGRPLASLLFIGRTGTGKTELARILGRELFPGSKRSLLRIDCSEYALAHEYAKLIGSPPGYVGHDQGGSLTEALAQDPECVVLFDEVEKAHPRVHNLLLQALEEGELSDGKGRRVSFAHSLVVLTANCGAEEMHRATHSLGFESGEALGRSSLRAVAKESLERRFAPELLGRLDAVVVFDELDLSAVEKVAGLALAELARRSRRRGLRVAITPAVARWVAERADASSHGAREVRHVIEREIEPILADRLLERGADRAEALLRLRVCRGELRLEPAP